MKTLTFETLSKENLIANNIECHRQIWGDGSEWLGYERKPRFGDGLILFNSDAVGEFYVNGKKILSASKGDAVYAPCGCLYRVKFKNGGKGTDTFTINFVLTDHDDNALRMADTVTLFSSTVSQSCLNIASELNNAFLFSKSMLKRQALFLSLLDSFSSACEKQSKSYYSIRKGID